jgi:tRNA threonylcarbamoyladenosine biosynthesis protein TsaE
VIVKTPPLLLHWPDENATQAFATHLAGQAGLRNAFVSLQGNLGAGKTTLVRHLLRALGVQGRVKSPTYAVVEPYSLPGLDIWHFDFYRFSDPREWEDAGFRDIFASPGLKLAEWPDRAFGVLPLPDLEIRLEVNPDQSRKVLLTAPSATGLALLQALQDAPLRNAGEAA